jgi:hypothetical protein
MTDEPEEILNPEPREEDYFDGIAERARAYGKLFSIVAATEDEAMRKEGLLMLGSLRKSFKQVPTGELVGIEGGKQQG